jgi:hypothetical protein
VRSLTDATRMLVRSGVLVAVLAVCAGSAAAAPLQPSAPPPDDAEIASALDKVKKDPNLATQRTMKMLQWRDSTTKPAKRPGWWVWIVDLFRWIDQSARVLVWLVVGALAGALVYFILRLTASGRDLTFADAEFVAPSHVRDLDIRPESLPQDIGAAARELWDRGERRAALALLYRGMLSRFAHVHQVPIRDSSTEGDCLVLAATHLPEVRAAYASRLVREWQRVVYGREETETATVYSLCDGFASALDERSRASGVAS